MFQTKIERNAYWAELRRLRQQYYKDTHQVRVEYNYTDLIPFTEYVKLNYGFNILFTSSGEISDEFVIVDEELYFMYKLQGRK